MLIGIDVGGTNTKIGIVNESGKVLARTSVKTQAHSLIDSYIDAIYDALLPLVETTGGWTSIEGIGIGVPNGNFYSGNIEHAANLPWKGIVPLQQLVSEKFSLPCKITNDANAAALGEMVYGVAKGMKDFIMITLGTGVGSGIVANGQLIYGHDGFAGELGHTVIVRKGGRPCGCGQSGCLETYTSANGVAITARQLIETTKEESSLRQLQTKDITSKDVFDAAIKGDKLAIHVFEETGQLLGEAFANFVAFSAPEAIILFGGLTRAQEILTNPIRKSMEQNLLKIWKGKIKLLLSHLPEDDAGILGAASLIANSLH